MELKGEKTQKFEQSACEKLIIGEKFLERSECFCYNHDIFTGIFLCRGSGPITAKILREANAAGKFVRGGMGISRRICHESVEKTADMFKCSLRHAAVWRKTNRLSARKRFAASAADECFDLWIKHIVGGLAFQHRQINKQAQTRSSPCMISFYQSASIDERENRQNSFHI